MNNIKFRAWFDGELYYFSLGDLVCGGTQTTEFCDGEFENWGQFIGVTDKNGKEIYEGDIVRHTRHDTHRGVIVGVSSTKDGTVVFEDCRFTVTNNLIRKWDSLEVVGNIYENTELIK